MNLLYLTILLPLLGFLLLAFSRGRWSENLSAIVGVGSVGLAALITCWLAIDFMLIMLMVAMFIVRHCGIG